MKPSTIMFWLSWLILAATAVSLYYQQARERHDFGRAEVGGLWICKNPNELGRLECLTLPEGSILLVPQGRQEGPQNDRTATP